MRTSTPVWISLVVLILVAIVAYAVVKLQRTRREHRARSDERAAAMMLAMHEETRRSKSAAAAAGAANASSRPQPARAGAAPRPATLVRKPRILSDAQRALYLALRAGMPDHTIMANIRIVDLLQTPADAAAIERDSRLRELLRERTDMLVCDADLVPLAALVIYEAGIPGVPDERVKVDALREIGVKFLRFRADSLPRPAEIRALILG